MSPGHARPVTLDGLSLTPGVLARIARDPESRIRVAPAALKRVERAARLIEEIAGRYAAAWRAQAEGGPKPQLDYGVTTGFGEFKTIPIDPDALERTQANILLSHSAGAGDNADADDPAGYFPADVVRAAMVIRLNAFLRGHSGVSVRLVRVLERMINRGIVPLVPVRGSVGSSGDLCPLAHCFSVLLGSRSETRYAVLPFKAQDIARKARPARRLAADLGYKDRDGAYEPGFKEGLALTNGATFSAALLALSVEDAANIADSADVAAALSMEALCACARAFDPKVHDARGFPGQADSAANIRALLRGSRLIDSSGDVQDAYSLRCAPAVHGAARDAVAYARFVAETEINAATDNPLFFPGPGGAVHSAKPWDSAFRRNWPPGYDGRNRASYSAGNFHGQPLGLAADFLAMAVAEIADISERRTQLLLDRNHNRGLPANLIPIRGVNSGMMLAQYCAASIVSENKVLAHPASVDSIPTSANIEDHVAMSTTAARKLRTILRNVEAVLAVECVVGAQAVEWRTLPRSSAAGGTLDDWTAAQRQAADFRKHSRNPGATALRLGAGTSAAYRSVRTAAKTMTEDRPLSEDIRRVRALVETGSLVRGVPVALRKPRRFSLK